MMEGERQIPQETVRPLPSDDEVEEGEQPLATRRQNLELQESANQGQPLGQINNLSGDNQRSEDEETGSRRNTNRTTEARPTKMNYIEIKKLIERRTLANKKGKLTDDEIKSLVKDWHDHRAEGELNQETVEREIRSMEKSVAKYKVEQLGNSC